MGVLAPGVVVGGCRIEGVVGKGGMGVVYLARELELERDVALKVISPELTEDALARGRFLAEARAAAAVEHPNVVPVHAVGTDDDRAYLVMRFIRGDDLRTLVRRDGLLSPLRAAAVAEQLGDALDAIHRAGYVHRDVKPANVLIDDDGRVYLSDFGLAKAALATHGPTSEDHWVGTLDYVAPEQIRGELVDARTDVYALGGVLHFMLTGLPPFERAGEEAKLWAHLHEPPPRPSTLAAVPAGFDAVVAGAMAKDPADRHASAGELGRMALAVARGEPVASPTVTARRPLHAAGRRWRGAAALGAAAAAGALAVAMLASDPRPVEQTENPGEEPADTMTPTPTPTATRAPVLTKVKTYQRGRGDADGIALAAGGVWVVSDDRTRPFWFDSARRASRKAPRLGRGAVSIAADGDAVWIALKPQRLVVGLDARTGEIRREIPTALPPIRVAAGSSGVWIATRDGPTAPVTLLHHTRDGSVPLGPRVIENGVADMVHGGGALWLAVAQTRGLWRFDEDGGELVDYLPVRDTSELAYGAGALWAVSGGDTLTRYTVAVGTFATRRLPSRPGELAVTDGVVIVTLQNEPHLLVFDARRLQRAGERVRVPRSPSTVAARGRDVWVAGLSEDRLTHLRR